MKKIKEEFVRTVEQEEGLDTFNYRRFRLKETIAGKISPTSFPYSKEAKQK